MKPIFSPKKILVRCPNWVGDVIMATPAFRSLRRYFREAKISLLLKPKLKKILEESPWFDQMIDFIPGGNGEKKDGYFSLVRKLREEKFDLAVVFPNSFSSALMVWMAGIRKRLGYRRNGRGFLLTDKIEPLKESGKIMPVSMVDYYLSLVSYLGCETADRKTELFLSEENKKTGEDLFKPYGIKRNDLLIAIAPGASFGTSKCWPGEFFARVADLLQEKYRVRILLLPGPGEEDRAGEIEKLMKKKPVNFCNPVLSLDLLKAVIYQCSLLLANDSGPRHFAHAFDKPTVVIMGSTDPRYTAYYQEKTTVLREDLPCSPCHLKECPADHQCMRLITPKKVFSACEELIEKYC